MKPTLIISLLTMWNNMRWRKFVTVMFIWRDGVENEDILHSAKLIAVDIS